ncbi:putative 6-phosphofructokinase [Helianthus annuus]|nr:putative 6-phosphofructokinase [Helianthus annuus]
MDNNISCQMKIETGEAGYVLEDVPHLTDYIPDLPGCPKSSRLVARLDLESESGLAWLATSQIGQVFRSAVTYP